MIPKNLSLLKSLIWMVNDVDIESQEEIEDIQAEIHIMSQLDNPFITKYFGSFIKKTKLWIIMEFCSGGSCLDLVESLIQLKPGPFSEAWISAIMRDLVMGLDHLHTQNKLHRDIKVSKLI